MSTRANLNTWPLIFVFILIMASAAFAGTTLYVDADASPGGDGSSWDTAFKYLQDGLVAASYGDEIRVAQGSYKPDLDEAGSVTPGNREETFQLINGVALKGGYAGAGEPEPNERDVEAYETILSGDINGDDVGFTNNGENCYHVTVGSRTDPNTVLDSFTITAGNANSAWPNNCGGGMYNLSGRPTVISCKFTGNSAAGRGGGMYNHNGGPTVTGCTLSNNFSGTNGGGMYNHHQGPILSNCIITDNFAASNGGGIGGDNLYMGDLIMTNSIIVGNEAGEYGGGMFEYDDSDLYLTNSILWDNIAYEGPQMALASQVEAFIRHCCFQGGWIDVYVEDGAELIWDTNSNIDADPLFANADNDDYHLQSQAGRWDAASENWVTDDVNSPCIDAGDPNSDWTEELWPHGKRINMGMYGGTLQASMSESPAGNIADLDANDVVNYADLKLFTDGWLRQQVLLSEDLDRDGSVNFKDFAIFADNWLWEQ